MSFVTVAGIREKVGLIAREADDPERAHAAEDLLHRLVLQAIAFDEGASLAEVRVWAREALKTQGLCFARFGISSSNKGG